MRGRVNLLFALALLLWSGPVLAESASERFERVLLEFEHKNFGNVIQILNSLLYPAIQLTREDDIAKAREMLGLSYFYIGEEEQAREEFTLLLYLRPGHRLDPFLIPPAAVHLFDQIWSDPRMKEKLEQIEKERQERQRQEAEKGKKPIKTVVQRIYLERTETQHHRLVAFLPFGLGQLQNGHTTKGILLAAGGGLALFTNLTCYSLLGALRKPEQVEGTKHYYYTDIPLAKGLRVAQYVSLGVFAASWVYGIIDANLYFVPTSRSPYRQQKEGKEGAAEEAAGLLPVALPGGVALSFQARF